MFYMWIFGLIYQSKSSYVFYSHLEGIEYNTNVIQNINSYREVFIL